MSERGTSIIFWLISIILFLSPFIFIKKDKRVRPIIINQIESKKIEYNNGIQVHIVGAIENPGIYTVKVGTKLYELLNVIQLQSSASTSHLNLARTLRDGQRIVIKEIKDIRLININLATKNDLKQIPGIGSVIANRLIEYRHLNGPFKSSKCLVKVKGLSERKINHIKRYISF